MKKFKMPRKGQIAVVYTTYDIDRFRRHVFVFYALTQRRHSGYGTARLLTAEFQSTKAERPGNIYGGEIRFDITSLRHNPDTMKVIKELRRLQWFTPEESYSSAPIQRGFTMGLVSLIHRLKAIKFTSNEDLDSYILKAQEVWRAQKELENVKAA